MKEHRITLVRRHVKNNMPVKSNECKGYLTDYLYTGTGEKPSVIIKWDLERERYVMLTRKGEYNLCKHETQNYYYPSVAPVKCHVILRAMGGEIIYWPEHKNPLWEAVNG